jgi:hypothetical protein
MNIQVLCAETAWISTIDKPPGRGDGPPNYALTVSKVSLEVWHHCFDYLSMDIESCDVVFDEGGTAPLNQIILKPEGIDGVDAINQEPDDIPVVPNIMLTTEKPKQMHTDTNEVTKGHPNVISRQIFSDPCKQPTQSHHGYKYLAAFIDNKL